MFAEGDGGHLDLMAFHPVLVAANRVDLAIVRKRAEGLRQPPLRKGVGGITLVEDRDAALEPLVEQVGVEDRQRLGQEQDRKSVVSGKRASVRVGLGVCLIIKKKKNKK